MITIFFRTIILYILVLFSLRLMGKGELSELQPFELVTIILIAELASIPMEDLQIPLINGVISIFTLVFLQIVISLINLKSEKARGVICGKPSILIERGQIVEKELKSLRININDLVEQLRIKDYPSIEDVEFAILETNGDLSIIPKSTKNSFKEPSLPISIIIDGKINHSNFKKASIDFNWLYSELEKQGINNINQVLYGAVDNNRLIIQKKQERN